MLGEALSLDAGGVPPPEAKADFQQALALEPTNAAARYYIGRADIAAGQVQQGLALWRSLAAALPPNDNRREALLAEIDSVSGHGVDGAAPRPAQSVTAPATIAPAQLPPAQLDFIRGMVSKQAADLDAHPDDPDGWARLVRSYGVLGDGSAQAKALAKAERLFANRPDALAMIRSAAASSGAAAGQR
jgi:cytochrome c-type biogenesis protein CcmH